VKMFLGLVERVETGVKGLDEVIEEVFPKRQFNHIGLEAM